MAWIYFTFKILALICELFEAFKYIAEPPLRIPQSSKSSARGINQFDSSAERHSTMYSTDSMPIMGNKTDLSILNLWICKKLILSFYV